MANTAYGGRAGRMPADDAQPRKKKQKQKKKRSLFARIVLGILNFFWKLLLVLLTLLVMGVLTAYLFFNIFQTYVDTTLIPSLEDVDIEALTMNEASTIYYQDNDTGEWRVLDTIFSADGNRKVVEYSDLPKHLIDAVVAIEDHRFWTHQGVDWEGTAAAFVKTFTTGSTRGGSTITQQMLRNITQDNDVTVKRKVREIFRALEFEKTTSKEDILTTYLNYVYFGSGCYGVQTAAEKYFGKNVSELTLAEAACIIGITNNPSLYDPFRKAEFVQSDGSIKTPRDFNKKRQETILDRMADPEIGYITQEEAEAAKAEFLMFTDTEEYKALHADDPDKSVIGDTTSPYSWFTDMVINEATSLLAEEQGIDTSMAEAMLFRGGYHIYTTLDMDIQNIVDRVYEDPSNFDYPSARGTPLDSAITVIDPYTGDIVAVAGGVGEKETSRALNLATARRPCGSAIKPVSVYAPAIDADLVTPASIVDDYPVDLNEAGTGGWPKNSNGKFKGYTTITDAVYRSLNTVAVRTLQELGTANAFYFMEDNLGFDLSLSDNDLAPLSMGGLTYGVSTVEMAAAFGAFVNEGIYTEPRTVVQILANDNETEVVNNSSRSRVAMKETTAYLMNQLLRGVVTSGTGTSASFKGMTIAGKTGTTSQNFDRYFVGYTPYYSAAVWVGYSKSNEKINSGTKNPAALAWKMVMEEIHKELENKSFFEKPEGIEEVTVCADCGLLATELCALDYRGDRSHTAEVQSSAIPTESCTCHVEARFCTEPETGTLHLAGDYCPPDSCTYRVVVRGRQFMEIPSKAAEDILPGEIVETWTLLADDTDAHLTYWQNQGYCTYHSESWVAPPEEPVPGDDDYDWGFDWGDWWPWGDDGDDEEPVPGDEGYQWPEDGGVPSEPEDPALPEEPVAP